MPQQILSDIFLSNTTHRNGSPTVFRYLRTEKQELRPHYLSLTFFSQLPIFFDKLLIQSH